MLASTSPRINVVLPWWALRFWRLTSTWICAARFQMFTFKSFPIKSAKSMASIVAGSVQRPNWISMSWATSESSNTCWFLSTWYELTALESLPLAVPLLVSFLMATAAASLASTSSSAGIARSMISINVLYCQSFIVNLIC